MGLPTGQMREETQKTLDEYNELYNWEYNDMCDFIESYGEDDFINNYETYTTRYNFRVFIASLISFR